MTEIPEWQRVLTLLRNPASREYCKAHGLKRTRGRVNPCRLYEHEPEPCDVLGAPPHYGCKELPCVDHPTMFLMDGKAAVVISQPYDLHGFKDLLLWTYSRPVALVVNEWPSWHFPQKSHFLEVWASWAWDIARERRRTAPKPVAASKWVAEWAEKTAKARGER